MSETGLKIATNFARSLNDRESLGGKMKALLTIGENVFPIEIESLEVGSHVEEFDAFPDIAYYPSTTRQTVYNYTRITLATHKNDELIQTLAPVITSYNAEAGE